MVDVTGSGVQAGVLDVVGAGGAGGGGCRVVSCRAFESAQPITDPLDFYKDFGTHGIIVEPPGDGGDTLVGRSKVAIQSQRHVHVR